MIFADSIWINASPPRIWEHVACPDRWPRFYAETKCAQISPEGGVAGSLYAMEFGTHATRTLTHCEIVDLRPGSMIAVKCTVDEKSQPMLSGEQTMLIAYELQDEGPRTKVTERVEMTGTPDVLVNWLTTVIGWLIYRFRKLAGNTTLRRLKRVVEGPL